MERAQNIELAKRINQAYVLLKKEEPSSHIVESLMERYGVSRMQAYRYIHRAKENDGKVDIPEVSRVFTVKLPISLIKGVRRFARSSRMSISKVVQTALEEFLRAQHHGKKGETS